MDKLRSILPVSISRFLDGIKDEDVEISTFATFAEVRSKNHGFYMFGMPSFEPTRELNDDGTPINRKRYLFLVWTDEDENPTKLAGQFTSIKKGLEFHDAFTKIKSMIEG